MLIPIASRMTTADFVFISFIDCYELEEEVGGVVYPFWRSRLQAQSGQPFMFSFSSFSFQRDEWATHVVLKLSFAPYRSWKKSEIPLKLRKSSRWNRPFSYSSAVEKNSSFGIYYTSFLTGSTYGSAFGPSEPVLSLETFFFSMKGKPWRIKLASSSDCCYVFVLDWYHTSKEGRERKSSVGFWYLFFSVLCQPISYRTRRTSSSAIRMVSLS